MANRIVGLRRAINASWMTEGVAAPEPAQIVPMPRFSALRAHICPTG
jgi:hypothetical protein